MIRLPSRILRRFLSAIVLVAMAGRAVFRIRRPLLALVPLVSLAVAILSLGVSESRAAPRQISPTEMQTGVAQRGMAAVLVVYSNDAEARFLGSAFLWGDGDLVISNAHVVGRNSHLRLQNQDGLQAVATVVMVDRARDIAILRLPAPVFGAGLSPAASQTGPQPGDVVFAFGAPLETTFSVTRGIVSALARQVEPAVPVAMIQHDAAINPGSSGGALLDARGNLLGMNSQIADGSRLFAGISYAIPARVIQRLIQGDLRPVPVLGLTGRDLTPQLAGALGRAQLRGVLIDHVVIKGRADRAGLRPGDVVIMLDDQAVKRSGDLAMAIDRTAGEQATMTIRRAGQVIELSLDLSADRPAGTIDSAARGISLITAYDLQKLGIELAPDSTETTHLSPASPAYLAGLSVGDRIIALNGKPTTREVLQTLSITAPALFLVQRRDGHTLHVLVDPWSNAPPMRPLGGANALDPDVVIF